MPAWQSRAGPVPSDPIRRPARRPGRGGASPQAPSMPNPERGSRPSRARRGAGRARLPQAGAACHGRAARKARPVFQSAASGETGAKPAAASAASAASGNRRNVSRAERRARLEAAGEAAKRAGRACLAAAAAQPTRPGLAPGHHPAASAAPALGLGPRGDADGAPADVRPDLRNRFPRGGSDGRRGSPGQRPFATPAPAVLWSRTRGAAPARPGGVALGAWPSEGGGHIISAGKLLHSLTRPEEGTSKIPESRQGQ